ncbi:LytTR family transcriptional regulator DNA-binding domain-containing protein [Paenibacillus polymyxa]|uniref:LytTR family transcriptional regulator DNA-binding domain-containing protein n=1 Tax=Paenibacillus polymyxa TaxID=1406 RepID=UPI0003FC2D8B|nr:LytTR family transcriptional regulator DNA-binding domain-containing protein [Paenibacillus polymyxa]
MNPDDRLKVVKREGKKLSNKATMLPVKDIKGFDTETKNGKSKVVYKTAHGEYIDEVRIEQTVELLCQLENFTRVDRGSVVNLDAIEEIDEIKHKVYLDKMRKICLDIAAVHIDLVRELFNKRRKRK